MSDDHPIGPHGPIDPERARSFAQKHGISEDEARRLLDEHGEEGEGLDGALKNLLSFLKAPS